MNFIEQKLAKMHNREYCVLVGNGTSAIYLSLISQDIKNKKVALPNNTCMNVVIPVYLSGNIPVFVDIEKETFGIDINLLEKEKDIEAVIAVHAYGNICEIEKIEKYCRENSIFLIEDLAVAQGLSFNNRKLGSFGDVSILSFGSGKVIDIGHGGAILTDNERIYKNVIENLKVLNKFNEKYAIELDKTNKYHTQIYNIDFGKSLNKYVKKFREKFLQKRLFIYKFDENYLKILDKRLNELDRLLQLRKNNASYLKNKFQKSGLKSIEIMTPKNDSSYWRFNIFIKDYRNELFKYLLDKKYKISSWYHSLDLMFEEKRVLNTPLSDWVGEHIINIWVNEEINQEYLDKISDDIIDFLKGKENV